MEEYEIPEFIVRLNLEANAIRVVDSKLSPSRWKISVDLYELDNDFEPEQNDIGIKTAIAKIRYWLENIFQNSLILSPGNSWAAKAFFNQEGHTTSSNNIVLLPDDPSDDIIAEILQSKFNAFGYPYLQFGSLELVNDDDPVLSYIFNGVGEINLPEMDDWIGTHAYHDVPWWARDDASTVDVIPSPDADLTDKPKSSFSLDFIRQTFEQTPTSAAVIKPNFKPRVIDGGNSDD